MYVMADGYVIYLLEFAREVARSHAPSASERQEESTQEETERLKQRFMAVFLWLIGYIIEQIFGKNGHVAAWCLFLYALSYIEHLLLKKPPSRTDTNNPLAILYPESISAFNFDSPQARLNYAKARLILSGALSLVWWPISYMIDQSNVKSSLDDEESKSFVLFVLLVAL
jgi:hypothetical protein